MRQIDKSCLATMRSPIRHLMQRHLENSLFAVAPERKAEFETTLDGFNMKYVNQRRWMFCADPATKEIFVSRGAVELIWCASLAHFLYYTRLIQGQKFTQATEIDPHSDTLVSDALYLLSWAITCQKAQCDCVQPIKHITCFKACDFRDLHAFARELLKHDNDLSAFLYANLSDESRRVVDVCEAQKTDDRFICEPLIQDLNRAIHNGSICERSRHLEASLKPETRAFFEQRPEHEDLYILNRFALEDAYEEYIIPYRIRDFYLENWPPGRPAPQQAPREESDENVADELCLVASAFLLHHELVHIRREHTAFTKKELQDPKNAEISIAQEKEADNEAADWLLSGIDVGSKKFVKRILGISQGCVLTTAMGLHGGHLGGESHPFSYDRMDSLLKRFLGKQNHIAKGMAFAVLNLHFQSSGRTLKMRPFADPEEALEALCDQIAEEAHSARAEEGPNT